MARYVMANRRAGKFREPEKRKAREAVDGAFSLMASAVNVTADFAPSDLQARRVVLFEADPAELKSVSPDPNVIIEPEILHWTDVVAPADLLDVRRAVHSSAPVAPSAGPPFLITAVGNGRPLFDATLALYLRGAGNLTRDLEQVTDANGQVRFSFEAFWQASAAVVVPAGGSGAPSFGARSQVRWSTARLFRRVGHLPGGMHSSASLSFDRIAAKEFASESRTPGTAHTPTSRTSWTLVPTSTGAYYRPRRAPTRNPMGLTSAESLARARAWRGSTVGSPLALICFARAFLRRIRAPIRAISPTRSTRSLASSASI